MPLQDRRKEFPCSHPLSHTQAFCCWRFAVCRCQASNQNFTFQSCQRMPRLWPRLWPRRCESMPFCNSVLNAAGVSPQSLLVSRTLAGSWVLGQVQVITHTAIMPQVPQSASFSMPKHALRVMRGGAKATKAVATVVGFGALGGLGGVFIADVLQVTVCDCPVLPSLRV